MTRSRGIRLKWSLTLGMVLVSTGWAEDSEPVAKAPEAAAATSDTLLRAMVDELQRSLTLRLEDLNPPYFVQFDADDTTLYRISARYGALTATQDDRRRMFSSRVRVGGYDLDNTNFAGGGRGGGRALLPLDDDYTAIRQAIWSAVDRDYKRAVEVLTRKQAYLEHAIIEDRPADFVPAEPVVHLGPPIELHFDRQAWSDRVRRVSARFRQYEQVQDSSVSLMVGQSTDYVVHSEGTRVRTSDTGVFLVLSARMQAEDGMRLSDERSFSGYTAEDLPSEQELTTAVDDLCHGLLELASAPILEEYTGPVLFDQRAAAQLFASLLAPALAARPDPIGSRRSYSDSSLEKKLGKRVLPRSFSVCDDPTMKHFGTRMLFGWYEYDDEGTPAQRVNLVEGGYLQTMLTSRAPTRKLSGSNGHGRAPGFGVDPRAAVANLLIESETGLSDAELKAELLQAADDEDLEFGLRVTGIEDVGSGSLQDPVHLFKVYVADGREERVRGVEFQPIELRALRKIMAVGQQQYVCNDLGSAASVIAPAVLMEEVEITRIEQEFDKLPILDPPISRDAP